MREREARHEVKVPARLRVDSGWQDAIILNLSSRGLMFRCTAPVQRGHFLELRRGTHVIVAQVVWSEGGRCGARAQGLIPIAEVVLDKAPNRRMLLPVERRSLPRSGAERAEAARRAGRAMELVLAGFGAVCAAFLLGDFARAVLGTPIERVEAALSAR